MFSPNKIFGQKCLNPTLWLKIFGQTTFLVQNFRDKKGSIIFQSKNRIYKKNLLGPKKLLRRKLWVRKILGPTKFWSPRPPAPIIEIRRISDFQISSEQRYKQNNSGYQSSRIWSDEQSYMLKSDTVGFYSSKELLLVCFEFKSFSIQQKESKI